jgi:histidinol-phosphate aminotransferase
MYNLPKKIEDFTPYEPLVGDYKIRLDVNESFLELPTEEVVRAVMSAENMKLNRYPDPYATGAVSAFADLFGVNPDCVTAGNGSDELIGLITAGLLEKGDSVLTLTPDFSMYGFYAKLYELQVHELEKDEDFVVDVDEVIRYINSRKIKCLFFSNPCNPTSLGIERQDVLRLVSETGALIVVDEAYMDFWTEEQSLLGEVQVYSNLVVLRTCSKSVALAGIRMGFAIANKKITRALRTVKSPFNVNSLTQAIAAAVLSDKVGYKKSIDYIKKHAHDLCEACKGLKVLGVFEKVLPTCTNFVFCKTEKAEEIYEYLLEQSIAVRCFGDYLRICAGSREDMNAMLSALARWKAEELMS